MIKDIIVNLSVTKNDSTVGNYAVSVAAALQAHLTGIAFIYDPIVPISGTGYIPADVIESQRADNETAADAAIKDFTTTTDRAGISAEPQSLTASLTGAGDQFARMARRFDLAIVGQAQPEMSTMEQIIGETTLFESGRPMIMVPYIQKAPFKTGNVMICWDGSRTAARAVADAIRSSAKAAVSKSSASPANAARKTRSRASISASISPGMDLKSTFIAFPRAILTLPTRCCRTPPTAPPILW